MKLDINKMVSNFLGWKLPSDFSPDGGIKFTRWIDSDKHANEPLYEPIGTNLFQAVQAKEMIEAMLVDAVSDGDAEPVAYAQENLVDIFKYSKLSVISKLKKGDDDYHYILPLYLAPPQPAERVKALEAENAKLRDALEKAAEICKNRADLYDKKQDEFLHEDHKKTCDFGLQWSVASWLESQIRNLIEKD